MMHFYSTRDRRQKASLSEAVFRGLAPDGGLFMPERIPRLKQTFLDHLSNYSFVELAYEIALNLLQETIPAADLRGIIERALTFEAPVVRLDEHLYSLELFHGPTLSFKDFGARFMAQLMAYLNRHQEQSLHILAATSGDTGSAVAHGFLDVPGINVWILYPKGQVSLIQEKQLTTMGHNVKALEIEGTFDDCQALVKQAFQDTELCQRIRLTSANSINIARLIPQSFYYFYAYAHSQKEGSPVVFSVPSGNFGNLTAGVLAKRMGLPIERFIAATNLNDSVPRYLETGVFQPLLSKRTLSNAMDVGNPSNFARLLDLYENRLDSMQQDLFGVSFSDEQTQIALKELYECYDYIVDPHGAVAYLGLKAYQQTNKMPGIFLETAHPAKFLSTVEATIGKKIVLPERLAQVLNKEKQTIVLANDYSQLKALFI